VLHRFKNIRNAIPPIREDLLPLEAN
jgi:hypothetical protein